jgi:hypothetical protein
VALKRKRRNPFKIVVRRAFCAGFNMLGFVLTWDRSVIGPWG